MSGARSVSMLALRLIFKSNLSARFQLAFPQNLVGR